MQHIFEKQSQMSWIDVLCNTKIQNPKIETVWVSYVDVPKNYSSAGGLGIQYYSMVFILQGMQEFNKDQGPQSWEWQAVHHSIAVILELQP